MSLGAVLRLGLSTFVLLVTATFVSAGLFPKSSLVKMINAKEFKDVLKLNQTTLIAFVAPWCGHCQRMVPEMNKAAIGLNPLIGTYAVDCDDDANKPLCSQQGIRGFPTVKVFPRGGLLPPMVLEEQPTATSLYNFAARRVPKVVDSLKKVNDVTEWVDKHKAASTIALLLTKDNKVPLLWKVLANKYVGKPIKFGAHSDKHGKAIAKLTGRGADEDKDSKSQVLLWVGGNGPNRYTGVSKLEPLTEFFDRLLDGKGKGLEGLIVEDKPMFNPASSERDEPKTQAPPEPEPKPERGVANDHEETVPVPTEKPLAKRVEKCEWEQDSEGCKTASGGSMPVPPKDEL